MVYRVLLLIALLCVGSSACGAQPDPLTEIRYCGPPKRDANGVIVRRADVLVAFKKIHPCPLDVLKLRAVPDRTCPNWQMNHVVPLANGGCDAVWNLDWMPVQIKTCAQWYCRDRFERKIYGGPFQTVP